MTRIITPTPLMSERHTAVLGALLVALGPISMAIYTPAMPKLTEVFATTPAVIKLTLTVYFAGFALAQLICGPLADAYGRRKATLGFLAIYMAATAVATWAPTIEWLVAARLVQGVGAAIGTAVSRAIVRDQYVGQTSARIMNAVMMMLALGPAISPTIGGITLTYFGWQEIFLFMMLYGTVLGLAVFFLLPETNPYRDPGLAHPARLTRNYLVLIATPSFMQPSLLIGLSLGSVYSMATILPFVMIEHVGLTPAQFGFGMIMQSGSFFTGTIVTSRLLRRFDAENLVPFSIAGMIAAMIVITFMMQQPDLQFLMVMAPIGMFTFSIALMLPAATTRALAAFPAMAGSASAMMGFIQFSGGFIGSISAAALGDPVLAMGTVVPAIPMTGIALYLLLGRAARRQQAAIVK